MKYSEEEIECYTNILRNLNDGLNIYTPILENIPLKNQKRLHVRIVEINIFSKIKVFVSATNVFILLVEFLSKIILPKLGVIFKRKVFIRDHIIYKIGWMRL